MSSRLAEVSQRMATARQLGAVIGAMRAIAASRSQEARRQLDGIRAYAGTVGQAIGLALALAPLREVEAGPRADGTLVVALCAEEGFAGAFSETVLATAAPAAGPAPARLFVVGDRGLMSLQATDRNPDWHAPMAVHPDQVSDLAEHLADALYGELARAGASRVDLVHALPAIAGPGRVVRRQLLPFDFGRFPAVATAQPPWLTLPPAQLVEQLAVEYVHAELCEALMLSHAAENQARMDAMVAAHGNIERRRQALTAEYHRVRQEEITSEIIELSGSRR